MFLQKAFKEVFYKSYRNKARNKLTMFKYKVYRKIFLDNFYDISMTPVEKLRAFAVCLDFIGVNSVNGDYYEFGLFDGNSFIDIHKGVQKKLKVKNSKFGYFDMHMYGFDSFEGLPEIQDIDKYKTVSGKDKWVKGQMAFGLDEFKSLMDTFGIPKDDYTLIKGFFNEVLNDKLIEEHGMKKAAIVNIDCDLYESTVDVLEFIRPLLQTGTLLIIDDYFHFKGDQNKGEARAFNEFLEKYQYIKAIEFTRYGFGGKVYVINIQEDEKSD